MVGSYSETPCFTFSHVFTLILVGLFLLWISITIVLCKFVSSREGTDISITTKTSANTKARREKPSYRTRWGLGLKQKWKCGACRKLLGDLVDVDHIIPLSEGGGNESSNLQLLCVTCHARKTRSERRSRFK